VNGEAGCTVCSQARLLKAVFPVTKGYELKRYECASCGSELWLVARVSRSSAPKQQSGRSRRGTRPKTIEAALKGASRAAGNPKPKAPPA
jgi:DNA-directed RNA polymerase subunit RPC12/RpoP